MIFDQFDAEEEKDKYFFYSEKCLEDQHLGINHKKTGN